MQFVIRRVHDDRIIRVVNSQVLAERIISILRSSGMMCYLDTQAVSLDGKGAA